MAGGPSHPYFPQDAVIPGYTPNTMSIPVILGAFNAFAGTSVVGSVALAKWSNPSLKRADLFVVGWFALCGFLHIFFEGYFVLNHASIPSSQSLFAQLWKQYALSDSRYLTSDPLILCVEAVTVITWGPLSLLTAYLTATTSNKKTDQKGLATRHLLQFAVSTGHLYGVVLYYGTCGFVEHMHGLSYSRPEAVYYWGYYVGMNAPWVVVPFVLLWSSGRALREGFGGKAVEEGKKVR